VNDTRQAPRPKSRYFSLLTSHSSLPYLCSLLLVLVLALASCATSVPEAPARSEALAVLDAFAQRVEVARAHSPQIIKAAEATAERMVDKPDTLLNVPYSTQPAFAEEILNRSGGLANTLPSLDRRREITDHDVLLYSVRSWEKDVAKTVKVLTDARAKGWLIVLFASRAGMPKGIEVDYLMDNGARGGGAGEAPVNVIANSLNAWLWHCEYVAALTRRGKCPGILKCGALPGAEAHNNPLQKRAGRHWLGECGEAIPPGKLSGLYLVRVEKLVRTLSGERAQGQINKAAAIVAARMKKGKVPIATATHILMSEILLDTRGAWRPFNVVWHARTALPENVKRGDLLVWFSFVGLSSPYEDYGKYIRQSGADLVTCFKKDTNLSNNAPEALAHIDQSWGPDDAEVPVPFPPGHMAPVSGLEQALIFRMLDAAAAQRLLPTDREP